ncbi:MAG: hypothetical protein EA356_12975 [Geminicoccaceae bacterium]|nr:MAG: hypothetical protein EA356_12975 [Geminicoccaceae bacterium]
MSSNASANACTNRSMRDGSASANAIRRPAGPSAPKPQRDRQGRYRKAGAAKTRIMQVTDGSPSCLTVTRLDGLAVARSGFDHSLNDASVVVHGTGRLAVGEEADAALDIDRVTMKQRQGPPLDERPI